jgi:glycosyltransferase involved in cell wall biosynthesis
MKVLFISSWYPNSMNPLKGIFVKKHAAAIKAAGADVEVLAITVGPGRFFQIRIDTSIDEYGITTHKIEFNSWFYKLIHLDLLIQFGFIRQIYYKRIKPKFQPDIIHSNVLYPAGVLGHKLAKKENLPHIITEHWSKVDKFMESSLYKGSGMKAYNSAKYVTVVSRFLKESIAKHIIDKEKIKVVPNAVDTNVFYFSEKKPNEKLTFTCVAHWTFPKRPDIIFNALEKFSGGKKNIILNIIGEGPLLNELKVKKWNFKVNYLGNLDRKDIAEKLRQSDYFLHASDIETFSIVIAEALSTGTPVLASNVGAIPELVIENNGVLCENSIESWSQGLHKLTQTGFDNKQISRESQRFGQEKIGESFMELYRSIVSK